jgi:enolase-phosphatase E1
LGVSFPEFSAVVTDVEGTTSSLSIVKDVLLPYSRTKLRDFIARRRDLPEVRAALEETKKLGKIPGATEAQAVDLLERWIDEDRKITPLKALQGLVWEEGYRAGALVAHVYPDVVPMLRKAKDCGVRLYVYSSGSVRAQHLFFEHTGQGDVRALFDGYFDTTTGSKHSPDSYRAIARSVGLPPSGIVFLSDARAELDAALAAGFRAVGVVRGDARSARAPEELSPHAVVSSFEQLVFEPDGRLRIREEGGDIESLVALGRLCHARGWALATSGNFSVRFGADRVAITASGRDKGSLSRSDVVIVDLDGRVVNVGSPPSAETPLHCALYRQRPEVNAVAHTHSIASTVLSRRHAKAGALRLEGYEMQKALAGVHTHEGAVVIPIVDNSQDMETLRHAIDEQLARCAGAPAYLVAGHGLTTWASDPTGLARHVEALEFLLACKLEADRGAG